MVSIVFGDHFSHLIINDTNLLASKQAPELKMANTVMLFVLSAFTVFGNATVLYILWRDPLKQLRTIPNYLIGNLAISDLVLGLLGEPLWAGVHWDHSQNLYSTARGFIDLSIAASFLTLLVLSVERYCMLKTLGLSRSWFQMCHLICSITLIWVLSISTAIAVMFLDKNLCRVIIAYAIGLPAGLATVVLYVQIFIIIRTVYRKDLLTNSSEPQDPRSSDSSAAVKRVRRRELDVAKTIFSLLGILILFGVPVVLADTLAKFCHSCGISEVTINIMITVGFMNAAFNPVVYALRTQQFRRAFYLIATNTPPSEAYKHLLV